jgi:hypothetical protein
LRSSTPPRSQRETHFGVGSALDAPDLLREIAEPELVETA